jgi:hypothetical protein
LLYHIIPKPKETSIGQFREILQNGTVERQEPDGQEIVASMRRAVLSNKGVEWYEMCFCGPPLSHERRTVYDRFFTKMNIEPATRGHELEGESFWDRLMQAKEDQIANSSSSRIGSPARPKYFPVTLRLI